MNNFIIVSIDEITPVCRNAPWFSYTINFYREPMRILKLFYTEQSRSYYPPFFMLFPIPFLWLFGETLNVAIMSNIVYFSILIFSVYGIGRHVHSKKAGLLAAFIVSMFPSIYGFSRMFWMDFPLTSVVALSIFLLLKTELFTSRKYSILLGVVTGVGMLVKWTFVAYLLPPLIALLLNHWSNKKKLRLQTWLLQALSLLL